MGKKYVPSGYQIIHLDNNDLDVANGIVKIESEDSKVLLAILKKLGLEYKIEKPILFDIEGATHILTFGHVVNTQIVAFGLYHDGSDFLGAQYKFSWITEDGEDIIGLTYVNLSE